MDLGPFHSRPAEWELYSPLPGPGRMLELGNKKNREHTYKAFFQQLGWEHVSVDRNGEDGALKLDLRQPLNLGTFDVVTNIGTTEHVSDQAAVWRNVVEAMHAGSILISTTPAPGDWSWHGDWYPDDEWYREFCLENWLGIDRLYLSGEEPRRMWFLRAHRVAAVPFFMPTRSIFRNVR